MSDTCLNLSPKTKITLSSLLSLSATWAFTWYVKFSNGGCHFMFHGVQCRKWGWPDSQYTGPRSCIPHFAQSIPCINWPVIFMRKVLWESWTNSVHMQRKSVWLRAPTRPLHPAIYDQFVMEFCRYWEHIMSALWALQAFLRLKSVGQKETW
jgi:hypothetical protein